jgi:hypothetical protein
VRFRVMVRSFSPAPNDLPGAASARGAGGRSMRASASRSSRSHAGSHAASLHGVAPSAVSPSVRAPPSAPISVAVGNDPMPDPEELAAAVELPLSGGGVGDLGSPATTHRTNHSSHHHASHHSAAADLPTPSRESSSIRLLREQHHSTMAQIADLEVKLQSASLNASASMEGDGDLADALAPQRLQLEELLAQLKAVMTQQQERLDALAATHELRRSTRAALPPGVAAMGEGDEATAAPVLEHSTIDDGDAPADPEATLMQSPAASAAGRAIRGSTSAPGSVQRGPTVTLAVPDSGAAVTTAVGSTSMRSRAGGDVAAAFGGGVGGAHGVFSAGMNRLLNRARGGGAAVGGEGEEDEDEEEAMRKMRAAEEEMLAVFNPSPEEQDPWGRVVWDSYTGLGENDDLILDAGERLLGCCVGEGRGGE